MMSRANSKFSLTSLFKWFTLVCLIFGIGQFFSSVFVTGILAGSAIGVFLAEHVATSKAMKLFALFIPPPLIAGIMVLASNPHDLLATWTWSTFPALLVFLVASIPVSALAIVFIHFVAEQVRRLLGIDMFQ